MVRRGFIALAMVMAVAEPARAELIKGPYLQNVTPSGITIMWQAQPAGPALVVVEGPGLPATGRTIAVPPVAVARVAVDGLAPSTRYRYRVDLGAGGPSAAHAQGEFATAPEVGANAPFSFIVYGDCGSSAVRQRRVVERATAEVPDFILGTGDLVNHGDRPADWQTWFDIQKPLLRESAIFPTLGNHDRQRRGESVEVFRRFFTLPGGVAFSTDTAPRYYAFSYGSARFLVLDSNAKLAGLAEHTAWLERELAAARRDPRVRHIFIALHHPAYSISLHGGSRRVREHWVPLFEKYRVSAVFSGHDHVYERAEANGIPYFVAGGGGALPYELDRRPTKIDRAAVKRFAPVNHYVRVSVVGDRVEASAILPDGRVLDSIAWGTRGAPLVAAAGAPASDVALAALDGAGGGAPGGGAKAASLRAAPAGVGMLPITIAAIALVAAYLVMMRALRRDL